MRGEIRNLAPLESKRNLLFQISWATEQKLTERRVIYVKDEMKANSLPLILNCVSLMNFTTLKIQNS
jgi:hypothetical protein